MKRKRKETCPSPILDESPKRTKVQAQRKFAQNSGVHSPIITPIRDLETADLPHTTVLPEPVELLPMKRPNTEDFLTFLCFRGTPILPQSLQFFNTASIVADGQVHEIKGDSSKNGPIDISKCAGLSAGSSSEKPFIAFGVRKRADPIVISRQMDRKRRHALAIQALRRKYQEQKMAKIRALTISKLSEKTTNKTLVKTNTIQKTETVTKKNNTLQKTKVIATKHVKVTTQTLKTKVKPRMCLRSFRGKFVQKELPFRPRRPEQESLRPPNDNKIARTSRNSNKLDGDASKSVKPKIINKTKLETPISVATSAIKRQQLKRRILVPNIVATIVKPSIKPKLRSTTMKQSVISRRKAQQRRRASIGKNGKELAGKSPNDSVKKENIKKISQESKSSPKKCSNEDTSKSESQKPHEFSKRLTRKDSELSSKNEEKLGNKNEAKKEVTKNLEIKREVKIAQSAAKKTMQKNLNLKTEFNLKSKNKDVKKNLAVQKNSDSVSEKNESGQKVTRDIKTLEITVNKVVTRKSTEDKGAKDKKVTNAKAKCESSKPIINKNKKFLKTITSKSASSTKLVQNTEKNVKEQPKRSGSISKNNEESPARSTLDNDTKRATRESTSKQTTKSEISETKSRKSDLKKVKENQSTMLGNEKNKAELQSMSKENSTTIKNSEAESLKEKVVINVSKIEEAKKEILEIKPLISTNINNDQIKKEPIEEKLFEIIKPSKIDINTNLEDIKSKQDELDLNVKDVEKLSLRNSNKVIDSFEKLTREVTLQKTTAKSDLLSKNLCKKAALLKKDIIDESKKTTKDDASKTVSIATSPNRKDCTSNKKDDNPKRKSAGRKEESEQIIHSRPSRKTKEAAAIYMEILSHKLVNDSAIDDDNVSIDSFPELPNVKKTEQREIELKAQAKTSKEFVESPAIDLKSKTNTIDITLAELKKPKTPLDLSPTNIFVASIDNEKSSLKKTDPKLDTSTKTNKNKPTKNSVEESPGTPTKTSLGKRKSNPIIVSSDDDSDNEVLQAKIRKSEAQKRLQQEASLQKGDDENNIPRRQTRSSNLPARETDNDSSDESFHIDVRVPRKKKVTRSRSKATPSTPASVLEKNVDIILEAARVLENEKTLDIDLVDDDDNDDDDDDKPLQELSTKDDLSQVKSVTKESLKNENITISKDSKSTNKKVTKECNSKPDYCSDSDESTTSDINLKSLQIKQRNKKLSKTKNSKSAASFSESDEEPLAKLTSKNFYENLESKKKSEKPKVKKTADKALVEVKMEPKPKRECTKRPSNYLAMLSSSDEDDEPYFHGFNTSKEELEKPKVFVQALAPSLDLLSKDLGRKGKVNMSNEQIEQWLKDSALAGSSVAKENDAMLKFGEKIPTETFKTETIISSSTSNIKLSECEEVKAIIAEPQPGCSKDPDEKPTKAELKSPVTDRKWIFKKDKKELMPNKNAFSPENECSVYAFGEENEDVVSTPFRRPSRRPSSTATSRSEDDLSKIEDSLKQGQFRKPNPSDSEDSRCFNVPQNPTKHTKIAKTDSMVPPSNYHGKRQTKPGLDRFPEPFDDCKYKIPSSPSASSGSSAKLYKKGPHKQKGKLWESINTVYVSDFPKPTDPAKLVEAPVFHPTEQEFQDPLEYIERIRHKAEQFGICKIIPPSSFKPECKVSDDMRFTAYNQYVHKMLHRWGPNFKEFIVIKKYLTTQSIYLKTPPLIGGMEIDLPRLYQTVQSLGGLKEVIEKKKWSKVSDHMKIPKSAQDRVTKLDDIYCKYLLPYDTLSPAEREKLFDEVETYWAKKESRNLQIKTDPKQETKLDDSSDQDYDSDENDTEECTVKGKNMALNAFYRIARNTMAMYFKVSEPTALEVEQEFWRYVTQKQNHICVHSASIDCGSWGYGFAVSKNSPFARHAWNLKVLSNNSGSVLRSLGPVIGVTIPTLHVGMVFSACCWYRDPHGLPWVEYLHTGGNKIWYGIPSSSCEVFHAAMQKLVPNYCRDKELWLPSDTAMVPPNMLMEHNVSLCRTIQEPGQFIVVFPKVYTSSICTGYVVSESVYFAPLYWLKTARSLFNDLKTSCEPSMFSLDKLLVSITNDSRSSVEVLRVIISFVEDMCASEKTNRIKLRSFGKLEEEKITNSEQAAKKKKVQSVDGDFECEVCRTNLYISMVIDNQEDLIYCLEDAIKLVEENAKIIERLKLKFVMDENELDELPKRINSMIEGKFQKKVFSKFTGLPTMLK